MVAVAEYVDVVGAVDLGGLDLRPLCLLRQPAVANPTALNATAMAARRICDMVPPFASRAASPVSAPPPCREL
jgi:hypothetical protein